MLLPRLSGRFYEFSFAQASQRPTVVVYVGIMGMTRAVWVGQERVWVGHGLPGLIARTASVVFPPPVPSAPAARRQVMKMMR